MVIEPRSQIHVREATRPGNGSSRVWRRTINGRPYGFTAVLMPDGQRRYFVERYNGYLANPDGTPGFNALTFGCAWSPVHAIIVPAPTGDHNVKEEASCPD